jgi:hypothetical protein
MTGEREKPEAMNAKQTRALATRRQPSLREQLSPRRREALDAKVRGEWIPLANRHWDALRALRLARHRVAKEPSTEALDAARALLLEAAELNRQLLKLEVECRMLLLGLGGDDDDSGSA